MKKLLLLAIATIVFGSFYSSTVSAGVNDFNIRSFSADYDLSKDDEGRSRLKIRETIVAEFPNFDQNHGLERAIPQGYDGHPTSLRVLSVLRQDGSPWNYSTYESNDNLVVRIGDADKYVHGEQIFVITYEQRDVTRYFKDTDRDEFYWDINGTEWQVPIQNLDITLHIDGDLKGALTEDASCYVGASGATDKCAITREGETFRAKGADLSNGENITVAVGFRPHTFAAYEPTLFEKVIGILITIWIALSIIGFGLIVWIGLKASRLSKRKSELGTIVPEYIPAGDTSVTVAASILGSSTKTFAAQLIDFAVRHYIKIYEIDKKWIFGSKDYELEIIKDISSLKSEEQEILHDVFSGKTAVGTRLAMSSLQNNSSVYMSTLDNEKKLKELVRGDYGLRAKNELQSKQFSRMGWVLLLVAILTLNPFFLVAAISAFIAGYTLWPFTDKGLALYRYLQGLKMYISVAEEERLKMLQSPEGAQKTPAGTDPKDPKQLVHLYERVLPYAILFGQEKQWNAQLGKYYESVGAKPDWYSSNAAFNAAAFGSAMNSFSSASSYTSASSSSSGGSSGGGSSGGGGGGGGGGGW